ncbi:hypothetical protein FQA39_LY17189 [Lamprigera yunnana]|nr:hypothetical protein FQA39_LY17189 [Lamprigera yunnana]
MICDYDEVPPEETETLTIEPDAETELISAKMFLQQCSSLSGDNLYDHLTDVLNKILAERPENVIDFFEEYSRKVKEKRFKPLNNHLEEVYVAPRKYTLAQKVVLLFKYQHENLPILSPEDEELVDMSKVDMLRLSYFFEQAGLGLPRTEMFSILLSLKKLIRTEPIKSIRFWGKILGSHKNYYVMETELKEDELTRRNELVDQQIKVEEIKAIVEEEIQGEDKNEKVFWRELPAVPTLLYEEPLEPPPELCGAGVNKKVYYVCNELGDEWNQLPDVTPKQIRVARQIKKSFTGLLNQEVITYPHFPGTERNYLRAQIARISAGSQISPLGFFTFKTFEGADNEEEGEGENETENAEEYEGKTNYTENKKYEPLLLRDLLDKSMAFWVHHTLYILPQGRTAWWNPKLVAQNEESGDEELDEEESLTKAHIGDEPETGPPLLTPLSEDASLEAVPPWSVRLSSNLVPEYALIVVRSNLWPGAYCFSTQGKMFENIYIGYGHKYMAHNFTPTPLSYVQQDYALGPEIMEMTDPTGAEEQQWILEHSPPPVQNEEGWVEEEEEEDEKEN